MQELFSSPGMITVLVIVLIVEALSLLLLFLNIQIFRSQSEKYRLLLSNLGDQSAWGRPGRILIPLYVLMTLGATAVTTIIFIFQPHLL
ncbi:MAG: hypothetical protein Q7R81_03740 [Candidatus Peregrinibacteria bacterium]|nr:hypothetical protein [Candidatus Peregrinibacteria bacterium]